MMDYEDGSIQRRLLDLLVGAKSRTGLLKSQHVVFRGNKYRHISNYKIVHGKSGGKS
jgi:hypothetical protein